VAEKLVVARFSLRMKAYPLGYYQSLQQSFRSRLVCQMGCAYSLSSQSIQRHTAFMHAEKEEAMHHRACAKGLMVGTYASKHARARLFWGVVALRDQYTA